MSIKAEIRRDLDIPGLLGWWFGAHPANVRNFLAILEFHGYEIRPVPTTPDQQTSQPQDESKG